MYKTILVPVDLAHPELGAEMLAMARTITGPKARIVLLNVLEAVPGYVVAQLPEGLLDGQKKKARKELNKLAEGKNSEAMVRSGHASTTILDVAEELGADLIVIASHRPGLQDFLLGSTAARVVRHANCAVLVHR